MEGLLGKLPWHSFERDLANKVSWFLELDKYEPATPGRCRRNERDQHFKMNTLKGQRESPLAHSPDKNWPDIDSTDRKQGEL